jgi:hypothetical protein
MGKMIVAIIATSLALISVLIPYSGSPLTQEQAVAISRNSPHVQQAFDEGAGRVNMEVEYWSVDYIRSLKEKEPNVDTKFLPDDHGVWRVHWVNDAPGWHILHFVDELTGKILHELAFVA